MRVTHTGIWKGLINSMQPGQTVTGSFRIRSRRARDHRRYPDLVVRAVGQNVTGQVLASRYAGHSADLMVGVLKTGDASPWPASR